MKKTRTQREALEILTEAREKLGAFLDESNPESGLEVIVLMAVKCDEASSEIDVVTSMHCKTCAMYLLSEATKMVEKERDEPSAPN